MKVYITQHYRVTTVLDVDLASCKDDDSIRCALALASEKATWLATQALRAVPEVKEAYGTGETAKFELTLEDALSQAAERESLPLTFTQGVLCSLSILDRYGDSIAYREVADPHDLNQLWEEADEFDREHLARHGYRPTPTAQESGDAD